MIPFRTMIRQEMKARGLSCYRLGQLIDHRVSTRMIQAYISCHRDMSGERLAILCEALGLKLTRPKKRKGK